MAEGVAKPVYWQTISSDFNDLDTAYDLGDVSGYVDILGEGLAGLIQAGLDGTQSDAERRWSEGEIDPLRILGSELDSLLDPDDTVQLEALNNRFEVLNNNPDIGNPLDLEQHLIRFGTEATHFAIRGEQFNANLNVVLTAIDNGEAPYSALFENLGGYVSAFELVDTGGSGGTTTTVGVRFENTDSTLANAERLVLDLGGIRLELDGSFPRDVQTVYDWSQNGFSVRTLVEATNSSVDAIRLVTPGVKVVEIDATGLSIRVPYDAPSADPGTGFERVLAAEIAGDFSAIMGTRYPWSEPVTEAEMSAMTLSEVSFKDLVVNTGTDAEEVVEQVAINMAPDAWTVSIDELRLIAEGQIGNSLQDLHELQYADPVVPLDERVDLLRLTTQPLIDGDADDLIRVEKIDTAAYVGGVKVNPGELVVDYSALASGLSEPGIDGENVIASDHDDTIIVNWSNGNIVSGESGDDHLGSRGGGYGSNDTFVGGDGADTFHLKISPWMTVPYNLPDFNPGQGDSINLVVDDISIVDGLSVSGGVLYVDFGNHGVQYGVNAPVAIANIPIGLTAADITDSARVTTQLDLQGITSIVDENTATNQVSEATVDGATVGVTAESYDPDLVNSSGPYDLVPDDEVPLLLGSQMGALSKSGHYVVSVQDATPNTNYTEGAPYSLLVQTTDGTEVRSLTLPIDARPFGNFDVVGLTDDGLYAFIRTWNGGFTGSSNNASGAVHRIDLTTGASVRLDVDAQGNTVTYQGWSLEVGDFDMTPDGSKVVMAIRDRIDPNNHGAQTVGIYLKDLATGSLTLIDDVDVSSGGAYSSGPRISDDGQKILFVSDKTGLAAGQISNSYTNQNGDLFVFDAAVGSTSQVNVNANSSASEIQSNLNYQAGNFSTGGSGWLADISGDGRYVVFNSANLGSGSHQVYRMDLQTRQIEPVENPYNPLGYAAQISYDGRYVAFREPFSDSDVYIKDMVTGQVEVVPGSTKIGNQSGPTDVMAIGDSGSILLWSWDNWDPNNPDPSNASLWVAPFNTEPSGVLFSLTDDAGGRFQIDPVTGVVTVADASLLTYEGGASHQVTVLATGEDGSTQTSSFTIQVTDGDLEPVYWQTISSDFNDLDTAYDLGDVSGYVDILGEGLAGLIQAGLDGTQSDAERRWSEGEIDPLRILGSELDSLLDPDDTVQLEALNNRFEVLNNNPDIGNPLDLEQHLIRFGTEATHFAIRGEQFNANLNVVLTAIDNGEAPYSALFENLGGYVSAFELVDTGGSGGTTTTVGVRFENTDSTLANAERLVLDLGGIRLELDGSFPRDVQTVYDWSQNGFSVRTLVEATNSSVDAIRLVTPGVKVVEIDATGLSIRVPYDAPSADPGTGFERVLAAEIAGDFSAIMGTRYPWSEPVTEAEMSAMTLSEVSFKDLVVNTGTDAEEVVEQVAINMAPDAWTVSIDELRLIAEGQIGNSLQDLHELQYADPVVPLDERVDLLRLTTQPLIDGDADDLIRVEKIDTAAYVGGVKVNPGELVVDYSALASGLSEPGIDGENVIASDHDDTIIVNWSNGNIVSGESGDDHLGSRGGGYGSNDTFVGGDGADTFHLKISPWMTVPYNLPDFNPGQGDRIELQLSNGGGAPVLTLDGNSLYAGFGDQPAVPVVTFGSTLSETDVLSHVGFGNSLGFTQSWGAWITDNSSIIYGTPGEDTISGGDADQLIYTLGGADTVDGGEGVDIVVIEGSGESLASHSQYLGNDINDSHRLERHSVQGPEIYKSRLFYKNNDGSWGSVSVEENLSSWTSEPYSIIDLVGSGSSSGDWDAIYADVVTHWESQAGISEFFIASGYDIEGRTDVRVEAAVRAAINDYDDWEYTIYRGWTPVDQKSLLTEVRVGHDWSRYQEVYPNGAGDEQGVTHVAWIRSLSAFSSTDQIEQVEVNYQGTLYTGSINSLTEPFLAAKDAIDYSIIKPLQPEQIIPSFQDLVDVYGYGSIDGLSVFGSTGQISWDALTFADYETEITTDRSGISAGGVESFIVDGSLYRIEDGVLSEASAGFDALLSSNSSNQRIFDFDVWYWDQWYPDTASSAAAQLVRNGVNLNLSDGAMAVNGVELAANEGLIGDALRYDFSPAVSSVTADVRYIGSEASDYVYIDTALYPSSEVYWSPGYDRYQATPDDPLYYDAHRFISYVLDEQNLPENTDGLSFAFDGAHLTVESNYGVSVVEQVRKVQDTTFNDTFTATDSEHRVEYRLNYGGIDVLETGAGSDRIRINPTKVWVDPVEQLVIHSESHGTVAVKVPLLSDDPDYYLRSEIDTYGLAQVEFWYANDHHASAGNDTVAMVYQGQRGSSDYGEIILQMYDLAGAKVGSELYLTGQTDQGDSPSVHHLGSDRYLVTWRTNAPDGSINHPDTQYLVGRVFDATDGSFRDTFVIDALIATGSELLRSQDPHVEGTGYTSVQPTIDNAGVNIRWYEGAGSDQPGQHQAGVSLAAITGDSEPYSESANGASVQDRQVVVTDYTSTDQISLESMGFDQGSWESQVHAVYKESEGATYISVETDSFEQADLVRLDGEFAISSSELKSDGDVELYLANQDPLIMFPEKASLRESVYYNEAGQTLDDFYNWRNDFRDLGAGYFGQDSLIYVNFTDQAQTYLSTTVAADTLATLGTTQSWVVPEQTNFITYRGTAVDDVVWLPNDVSSYSVWTPGNDVFFAPVREDRTSDPLNQTGLTQVGFSAWNYGGLDVGQGYPTHGVTIDNSSGTMVVHTDSGTITGHNFDYFEDSRYDDVLVGSDISEVFYLRFGGSDVVTGGGGEDIYNFKINHGWYGYDVEGGTEIGYRNRITDYESGEAINLMMLGFDPVSFAEQIDVSYSAENDTTYISVNTDTFSRANFIALDGLFEANTQSLSMVYDAGDPEQMLEIRLSHDTIPVAVGDQFEVYKDSGVVTLDVLANDTDADGDLLSVSAAISDQGGTVSVVDGQLRYQPREGFNGTETITYTITDGENEVTQTADVVVSVPYRLFGVEAPDFAILSDEFVSLTDLTALSMGSTHALVRADFAVSGGGSDARHLVLDLRSGTYEGSVESVLGEGLPERVSVSSVSAHWPDNGGYTLVASYVDVTEPIYVGQTSADWRYELLGVVDQDGLVDADLIRTVRGEPGNDSITRVVLDHDGEWVAFESRAGYIPSSDTENWDTNQAKDVYVADLAGTTLYRASIAEGLQSSLDTLLVDYQRDGSRDQLLMETVFGGWTLGTDDNVAADLFLFKDGQLQMVTQTDSEVATGFESGQALFDGSRVIFVSASPDLPGSSQDGRPELYSHDIQSGITQKLQTALDELVRGSDYGLTLYRSNDEGVLVGVTDAVSGTGADADDLDGQIILLPETGGYQIVSATASGDPGDGRTEAFIEESESDFLFTTDSTNLGAVDGGGLVLATTNYYDVTLVTDTDPAFSTVSESTEAGQLVGFTASAVDSDLLFSMVTYSLTDDAGGRFQIDPITGVVSVLAPTLLDYETSTSHVLTVQAESADGSTSDTRFTVSLTDDKTEFGASAPTDGDTGADQVSETASVGDTVGLTALSGDLDGTDSIVGYSLVDDAGGRFQIDPITGIVTVLDPTLLDYETSVSHTVTVRAESSDGSTSDTSFTINLVDDTTEYSASAPVDSDPGVDQISETASVGDFVGVSVASTDLDGTDTVSFSLVDDAGGRFRIDPQTGIVSVLDPTLLDYEASPSHVVTVRAESSDGSTSDGAFTIDLIDDRTEFVATQLTDINSFTNAVTEGSLVGAPVGLTAFSEDGDGTDVITYSLVDDAGGRFQIDPETGVVSVADMGLIDFAQKQTYSVVVRASSTDGSESVEQFSIDQNSRPVFGTSSGSYDIAYTGSLVTTAVTVPVPTDVDESMEDFLVTVRDLPLYGTVRVDGVPVSVGEQVPVSQLGLVTHEIDLRTKGPIGSLVLEVVDSAGLSATWSADFSVDGNVAGGIYGSFSGEVADEFYGSLGSDQLYGFAGDDYLSGGPGDDELFGGVGVDQLFGGLGTDTLNGDAGDDYLDGGEGSDVLRGGQGNDVYVVDGSDTVLETQGGLIGGIDRIMTSGDWVLSTPNVEEFEAIGTDHVRIAGNELNNLILGNVGDNVLSGGEGTDIIEGRAGSDDLDGGSGRDRMIGGLGHDRYWVDGSRDIVTEDADAGIDHVYASVDHVLASHLEDLTLLGSGDIAGTGNDLDNVVMGNDGNNLLSGGYGGVDRLIGGAGDDIYKVYAEDTVVEDSSGTDLIISTVSLTLADGIENGELSGFARLDLTGNGLSNDLVGSRNDNVLDGKGGSDTLTGGGRSDTFVSSVSDGTYDSITDFVSGDDSIALDADVYGMSGLAFLDGLNEAVLDMSHFAIIDGDGVSSNVDAHVIYDTRDQMLRVDADGSGAGAEVAVFALTGTSTTIDYDDILLFRDV